MEHDNTGVSYNDNVIECKELTEHNNAHNSSNQINKYKHVQNRNNGNHRKNKNKNAKSSYIISRILIKQILNLTGLSVDGDFLYTFMIDKLDVLSVGNGIYQSRIGDRIVEFGFRDQKTKKVLYTYARKIDPNTNRHYEWSFDDILYTIVNIKHKYGIDDKQLPKALVLNGVDINNIPKVIKEIKSFIDNTKWAKVMVYNINNKDTNKRKLTLALTVKQFKDNLLEYFRLHGNHQSQLLPILICDGKNKKYYIEYVWIVSIEPGFDIGISFKWQSDCKIVTRIYVDKQILLRHHMLWKLHECHCLDGKFESNITCLRIGNVCEDENKVKDLKRKLKLEKTEKIKWKNNFNDMQNNVNDMLNQIRNMDQQIKMLKEFISKIPYGNNVAQPVPITSTTIPPSPVTPQFNQQYITAIPSFILPIPTIQSLKATNNGMTLPQLQLQQQQLYNTLQQPQMFSLMALNNGLLQNNQMTNSLLNNTNNNTFNGNLNEQLNNTGRSRN